MVNYARKEMRDETWRRWRGGKKLADDLRAFYTSKTAMDRVAKNNGFGSSPSPNGAVKTRGQRLAGIFFSDKRTRGRSGFPVKRGMMRPRRSPRAHLPGQDAPSR